MLISDLLITVSIQNFSSNLKIALPRGCELEDQHINKNWPLEGQGKQIIISVFFPLFRFLTLAALSLISVLGQAMQRRQSYSML